MASDNLQLPATLYRAVEVDITAARAADGPLKIAISSEEPVGRFFGAEILDHGPSSLDRKRLARGLPLCMDHDQTQVVGRVEGLSVGSDRVLRGSVRFSDSGAARQLESDMRAGIRPDISVGYAVDAMDLEHTDGDERTYRVTRWRPLEVSSVAVPADETVGVGRAADRPADTTITVPVQTKERTMEPTPTPPAAPAVREVVDYSPERKRAAEISKLAKEWKLEDRAPAWIESGTDLAVVQGEIMEEVRKRQAETVKNPVPLTDKEQKQYSLRKALLGAIEHPEDASRIGGFEGEVQADLIAARARLGIAHRGGLVIPTALRTGVVGTSSLGGALRFTEHGDFIELLRNATVLGKAGARFMTGLVGNVAMPKQLTSGTAYWLAEAGTVTNADLTYGLVTLSPKTLMYSHGVTRQMLAQSSEDVEAIIRADIVASQARELDRVLFIGTSTSNEPTGIVNDGTAATITMGANGGAITWTKVVNVQATVAVGNGVLNETAAYITNAKVENDFKVTAKFTSNSMPIWSDANNARPVNNYPVIVSNTVPFNRTKGTSTTVCSILAFSSAWNEVLVGQWGGGGFAEVIVDPYSQKKLGIVELTSYALLDIQYRHTASIGFIPDITTSL